MLLHETEKDNLLVQSCKLYMEWEFFFTELEALSYFTHTVTLPLLNCLETSSQKDLVQILSALYLDLAGCEMRRLDKYCVSYKHLPVAEPDSDLMKEILHVICVGAAYGMKLQCSREYRFAGDSQLPRATQLDKLTEDELFGLSTNNLSTERDFSRFNRLSEGAKFRNYWFQAKGIRNDMILYKSKTGLVQNFTKQVKNFLQASEIKWNAQRKILMKAKIQAKFEKLDNQKDFSRKLLEN